MRHEACPGEGELSVESGSSVSPYVSPFRPDTAPVLLLSVLAEACLGLVFVVDRRWLCGVWLVFVFCFWFCLPVLVVLLHGRGIVDIAPASHQRLAWER